MPIKLPKGFTRRKSSGNALEEVEIRPQPSFRVFERPPGDARSLSEGNLLAPKNRDSGGTDNSAVTTGTYRRPSSSYIDRPSNEAPAPENTQSSHSRGFHDIPPLAGALRAAGRTFSFGGRLSKQSPHSPSDLSMTVTSATPPKLLNTDFSLGKDSDFQSMLDDFEHPAPSEVQKPSSVDRPADPVSSPAVRTGSRPAPINTDRSEEVEPSPYSWDSRHSEEGLLSTFDHGRGDPPVAQTDSMPISEGRESVPPNTFMPPATTSHRALEQPRTGTDNRLRRSLVFPIKRASTPVEDEDARLIMESLYRRNSQPPFAYDHEAENEQPVFEHANTVELAPLRVRKSPKPSEFEPDSSIEDNARLAAQHEHNLPKSTSPGNKVMTPSQFEHYRQQQELQRSRSNVSKSEYSVESDYDEEDEAEKDREAERQRRKQEAHLSVYRQQVMKVTGQQSSATSLRTEPDHASSSTPKLTVQQSNPGNRSGSGKSSDGDEDEEIPLAILAAHGFPSKNCPPAQLGSSRSIPNLRAAPFQAPRSSAGSVYGDHDTANRSSVPAFAKNLPRDPYFGASLVNPSNRESLALGVGASVHGNHAPALPSGGLVGVIATEERARAIRRGSPNTQAAHEHAGGMMMPRGPPPHPASGIPRPYTMMSPNPSNTPTPQPQISATEQAQIQLSQQMSHMMQMQMQWMQQMMQLQGGQSSLQPPPQMPMGAPLPVTANPSSRPVSMAAAGALNHTTAGPQGHQRPLSMLDPSRSSRLNGPPMPYTSAGGNRSGTPAGQGYAPSIAPSERSHVGGAPRYRPVSSLHPDQGPPLAPPPSKPWNDENQRSSISLAKPSTPTVIVRPISSSGVSTTAGKPRQTADADDDENDDEGWAEMMKKRENKKSNWKTRRETSNLGDLLNVVH